MLYTNQRLRVKWGNIVSDDFGVMNSVKQGGVLSPILFTVYIDELLNQLKNSGFGCYIGNIFLGAFGYADDVMILAPSKTSMNCMLAIVNKFGSEFNVLFNPGKTKLIVFGGSSVENYSIVFNNVVIICEASAGHLGNLIGRKTDEQVIQLCINDVISKVNYILSVFGHCSSEVLYNLFKSYGMSLYGCCLWDFSSKYVHLFYTCWRKCIRKLLSLPWTTHSVYLPLLINDVNVDTQLHKRFLKFIKGIIGHDNSLINLCGKLVINGSDSKACKSLNYICHKYRIRTCELISMPQSKLNLRLNNSNVIMNTDEDILRNVAIIKEMLDMRDNCGSFFNRAQAQSVLDYICVV